MDKPRGEAISFILNSIILHILSVIVYESSMSRHGNCNLRALKYFRSGQRIQSQGENSSFSALATSLSVTTAMGTKIFDETVVTTCSGMTALGYCPSVGDGRTNIEVCLAATGGQ